MALILGVPTVELELQGTMQVPLRGQTGGELHPHLTDGLTDWPSELLATSSLSPGCDAGKQAR